MDDGSTDKTEELIKTIDDSRLKYIKLDGNHGACYARNVGIKESTGKYIAFQDSDDTFREEKLVYRNDDNISNDNNKLKKATILMIKKDYKLSEKQNDMLMDTLVTLHSSKLIKEKDRIIQNLYSDYSKLNKEYKIIEKDYRQIINSKRWKMVNKLLKCSNK